MYIHLSCPACSQRIRVPAGHAGKKVRCPVCKAVSDIPLPAEIPTEATASPPPQPSDVHTPVGADPMLTQDGELPDELEPPAMLDSDVEVAEKKGRLGFKLDVDPHEIRACLRVLRDHDVLENEGQIRDGLHRRKVTHGVNADQIKMACMHLEYATDDDIGKEFVIATGTPAIAGEAGSLEFAVDVTGEAQLSQKEGAEGRVDFKNMARITTVKAGQVLARVIPPVSGTPGVGLDGSQLPAPVPEEADYTLGAGVRLSANRKEIRAEFDGRPVWTEASLAVLQVYEISGNVDFSTGNIDFDGHVIVRGAVLDEFTIRCKSLEVDGTVGAALIVTQQDAALRGGVNGHNRGSLRVGGDCTAKYLNEVGGEVNGNLTVERGITNSRIGVLGELNAERIVGGDASALLGMDVNYLGSDLGVVTTMRPGFDYRVSSLLERLESLEFEIEDLGKKAAPYLTQGAEFERLDEEKQRATEEAFEALTEARMKRDKWVAALDSYRVNEAALAIRMVNVGSQLHADVLICIEDVCREFNEPKGGKWTISRDTETGQIDIGNYRRRPIARRDVEAGPAAD